MGIVYLAYDLIKASASGARTVAVHGYRASTYIMRKAYSIGSSVSIPATDLLNSATTIVSTGAKITSDAVKLTADTAKFVADNTIAVFVAIVSIIGILYSMASGRK